MEKIGANFCLGTFLDRHKNNKDLHEVQENQLKTRWEP